MIELDRGRARGELREIVSDARFDVPTTIDFHGAPYVVHARFSTPPTAATAYAIERVVRIE